MKKSQIAFAVSAAMGATAANAAEWVLTTINTQSGINGADSYLYGQTNFTSDAGDNLSMTGTLNSYSYAGVTWLSTERWVDWNISNAGDSSATSYSCIEGAFGAAVGASICGNYNFGANKTNESTIDGVGGRTIGGDDIALGPAQNLTGNYSGLAEWTDGAAQVAEIPDSFVYGSDYVALTTRTIQGDGSLVPGDVDGNGNGKTVTFITPAVAVDDPDYATSAGSVNVSLDIGDNDTSWFPAAIVVDDASDTATGTGSAGGTFVINSDPDVKNVTATYTPVDAAFVGQETWVYRVTDTSQTCPATNPLNPDPPIPPCSLIPGQSDTATVTVTVSVGGTANPDSGDTASLRTPETINIGNNDVGFADPSTATVTVAAAQGDVVINNSPGRPGPGGNITATYTSTAALGSAPYVDTFTYEITDGSVTDTAVVTVNVENTLPVANDLADVTLDTQGMSPSDVSVDIDVGPGGNVAGNALGDAPSVVTTAPANDVTTAVNGTIITITASAFTSAGDAVGYTITDVDTEADTGTIAVSIPDVSPTVTNVSETIAFAGPYSVSMPFTAGNGAVSDHSISVSQPQFGTIANLAVGVGVITFDYTPNGFAGPDFVTVNLTDGDGSIGSGTATLTMTGSAVTIPPQDSLPGSGGSTALSPTGLLGLLLSIPLLRGRRRQR